MSAFQVRPAPPPIREFFARDGSGNVLSFDSANDREAWLRLAPMRHALSYAVTRDRMKICRFLRERKELVPE